MPSKPPAEMSTLLVAPKKRAMLDAKKTAGMGICWLAHRGTATQLSVISEGKSNDAKYKDM